MANLPFKKNGLIIFDFDGTIADTVDLNLAIFNRLVEKYLGQKISKKKLNKLRNLSYREALKKMGFPRWKLLFILLIFPWVYREGKKIANQEIITTRPFVGVANLLNSLKNNYLLGIVTNNAAVNVRLFLNNYGLNQFSFVIENKSLFSKTKALGKAICQYNFSKENIYYIGDEVKDIQAAKKNGVRSVAVGWGYNTVDRLSQENPDFLVKNFKELTKILLSN